MLGAKRLDALARANARGRAFYERQGADALESHSDFRCSEASSTAAVLNLVRPHFTEFDDILDVGCGANLAYALEIAREGKTVYGVDFAMNFLRLASILNHPRLYLAQADALKLPFHDGTFSAVVCSETIEHIADHSAAVSEIARVLRHEGLFFITVPNLWNASRLIEMVRTRDFSVKLMEGHVREYSPHSLRTLLTPWFSIEKWMPVSFGWTGRFGGPIDRLIKCPLFRRLSKSVAFVARRR